MLTERKITLNSNDYAAFMSLYHSAFPKEERLPIDALIGDYQENSLIACYNENEFCGFYSTLTLGDITHILYLAISENQRGHGLGSAVLNLVSKHFSNNRIILDIEAEDKDAPNNDQRVRRKNFYSKNGYSESGIEYIWHGVPYKIMIKNGTITEQEFDDFWENIDSIRKKG